MPTLPCAPGAYTGDGERCGRPAFLLRFNDASSAVVTACPASLPPGATCEPDSPRARGLYMVGGSLVPGLGFVPLGMAVAYDDLGGSSFDGVVTPTDGVSADGVVPFEHAPAHDGLEGSAYLTWVSTLDADSRFGADDDSVSMIATFSRALGDGTLDLSSRVFLEQQGGTWTGATRTFAMSDNGVADFYRVRFDDGGGHAWSVWYAEPDEGSFDLDDLPAAASVDTSGATVNVRVEAFEFGSGYDGDAPSSYDELFGFDGADIDNLALFLGAWSSEQCRSGGACALP
jgi:hypothetical protein